MAEDIRLTFAKGGRQFARLEIDRPKSAVILRYTGDPDVVSPEDERYELDKGQLSVSGVAGAAFRVLPPKYGRSVSYIFGRSGSGKSTYAGRYLEMYHLMFPENKILFISGKAEDPEIDGRPYIIRVDPVELDGLDEGNMDVRKYSNSMMVFDDVESFSKDRMAKARKLMETIATQGRAGNTSLMWLQHQVSSGHATKTIIGEATHVVLFPQGNPLGKMNAVLKDGIGLTAKQVNQLRHVGRWACFILGEVSLFVSEKRAGLTWRIFV